jgi:hypothetical protein
MTPAISLKFKLEKYFCEGRNPHIKARVKLHIIALKEGRNELLVKLPTVGASTEIGQTTQ